MFETIVTAIFASVVATGLLAWLGKTWLEARISASIKHEYQKQLAMFERDLESKDKLELVAELLSEYMRTPPGEKLKRQRRTTLNRLSFLASLWLPAELMLELAKRLQNKPDAKSPFEIVLMARRLLTGDKSLLPEHITWWEPSLEKRGSPVIQKG